MSAIMQQLTLVPSYPRGQELRSGNDTVRGSHNPGRPTSTPAEACISKLVSTQAHEVTQGRAASGSTRDRGAVGTLGTAGGVSAALH